jgi:predicted transcriptional regulator
MLHGMDTAPRPNDSAQAARSETEAERQRRFAWEAEMIAEADAEIEAGLFVEEAEVDAWIDSLGTDHELPVPQPRR